jgi:hypothetical protein
MRFVISDIEGDTLDTFETQRDAVDAALAMMDNHSVAPGGIVLLAYQNDGTPFGPGVRGDAILRRKVQWQIKTDTHRPSNVSVSDESGLLADVAQHEDSFEILGAPVG